MAVDTFKTDYDASIVIKGLRLDRDGQVYFIVIRTAQTLYDEVRQKTYYLPTEVTQAPTATQIVQCKNYLGHPVDICVRAVVNNDKTLDVEFKNLLFYSEYTIFYAVANEFPIRPIVKDEVKTAKVVIGAPKSADSSRLAHNLLLLLIMICSIVLLSSEL